MPPESARFLRDMLDAANWNFCVIGEAMSQLKRIDEPTALRITDHWKIVGLRNQPIHGYGVINNRSTWDIIQGKLPVLIRELTGILGE
jgi:uncharacterized protein with HEPN domain